MPQFNIFTNLCTMSVQNITTSCWILSTQIHSSISAKCWRSRVTHWSA